MPRKTITRRRLLATGVHVTAALTIGGKLAAARSVARETGEVVTLYDPRFPRSRQLTRSLLRAGQPQAVSGDASPLLTLVAAGRARHRDLHLQGVTTETVPFCLEQFARDYHDVEFESRRLDRDLFVWSLTLRPRTPAP